MRTRAVTAVGAALLLALAGCSAFRSAAPSNSSSASAVVSPQDGVTGLGAPQNVWNAYHTPASAESFGGVYSAVSTDQAGRVTGYVLGMTARPLAQAMTLVRRDLPPDATADPPQAALGVEGTQCEIVVFHSATLGRALGTAEGDRAAALFLSVSAVDMDESRIISATLVTGEAAFASQC